MAKSSRGKLYNAEQQQFLIDGYQDYTITDLHRRYAEAFPGDPRSYAAIRSFIRNRKITCGGQRAKKKTWRCSLFTREEAERVAKWYKRMNHRLVAARASKKFGRQITAGQIRTFVHNHGIEAGRNGQYERGSVPANKGMKMPPGWSPGRMAETQFKPGHSQSEVNPMYHERLDKDGYIIMKTPQVNPHTGAWGYYMPKHQWIWQQANGPQPENHILTFIDGDRSNCQLDNLELISRGENARRNKMRIGDADPEARDSIKAIAKLQHNIGEIRRRKANG